MSVEAFEPLAVARLLPLRNFRFRLYGLAQVDVDKKNLTVDGDFIWGSIYVGSFSCPVNWQGYWGAHVEVDRNITPGDQKWNSFNVTLTSSFVVSSYLAIIEKDASGKIVSVNALNQLWHYNKDESEALSNKTLGIYVGVFDAVLFENDESVAAPAVLRLTYIMTAQAGVLDLFDGIPVVPKGVESILYVVTWPYKNATNTLTLVIAVGASSFSASLSGSQQKSGSGLDQIYFRVAKEAYIGTSKQSVKISSNVSKDLSVFGSNDIQNQLSFRYKGDAYVAIYEIQFPANSQNIAYDPTMGSGESPYDTSDSTVWIIVGVCVAFVVCVVVVGLIVGKVMSGKKGYSELKE